MIKIYGNDIERLISLICEINKTSIIQVESLNNINTLPVTTMSYVRPIITLGERLQEDIIKIKRIAEKSYKSITSVHNSYGSPYTELYDLKRNIDNCINFVNQHPTLEFSYDKSTITELIRALSIFSIDAKFAVITYHRYLQKGYDSVINGN